MVRLKRVLRRRHARTALLPHLSLLLGLTLAACGGGGGGSGSTPSNVQVLLNDGDVLPGNFTVGTIEEANMADDRSVVLIASVPSLPADRGVFLRTPDGNVQPVLTPATQIPAGVSLPTLHNPSMAPTGEFVFSAGSGLDSDTLFLYANGQLDVLAAAGQTPPGFRILGDRQLGAGGFVALSGGISPCTVDTSGGAARVRCTTEIFSGTDAGISQVKVPNDLTSQDPGSLGLVVNDAQTLVLGLPGRANDPAIAEVRGGQFTPLVTQRQVVPGLGTLSSLNPRAVSLNGDVVFEARVDTNGDGQPDDQRILFLSNGTFTTVARTGDPAGTKVILDARGIAIDDAGDIVFSVHFGDPGQAGSISLRIWQGGTTQEIAFEGETFGQDAQGNDLTILKLEQVRVARNGDVVFRATLGTIDNGTPKTSATSILRYASGRLDTLLQTGQEISSNNKIVSLTVSDLNNNGDLLSIGSINRSANRTLLLLPRQ
jgi:hypothetical protein